MAEDGAGAEQRDTSDPVTEESPPGDVKGFNVRRTRIVYYDDSQFATAGRFARVLGTASVVRGAIPLDSVDITVVIGSDFVKAHR